MAINTRIFTYSSLGILNILSRFLSTVRSISFTSLCVILTYFRSVSALCGNGCLTSRSIRASRSISFTSLCVILTYFRSVSALRGIGCLTSRSIRASRGISFTSLCVILTYFRSVSACFGIGLTSLRFSFTISCSGGAFCGGVGAACRRSGTLCGALRSIFGIGRAPRCAVCTCKGVSGACSGIGSRFPRLGLAALGGSLRGFCGGGTLRCFICFGSSNGCLTSRSIRASRGISFTSLCVILTYFRSVSACFGIGLTSLRFSFTLFRTSLTQLRGFCGGSSFSYCLIISGLSCFFWSKSINRTCSFFNYAQSKVWSWIYNLVCISNFLSPSNTNKYNLTKIDTCSNIRRNINN